MAVRQFHNGFDLFAKVRIGYAKYRHILYRRMQDKSIFNFLGVNVDAPGNDHVGLAVRQIQVAVGVDVADIAQRCPVVVNRMRGGFGFVWRIVVLEAALWLLEIHHALIANRQLDAVFVTDAQYAVYGASNRTRMGEPFLRADDRRTITLSACVILPKNGPPPAHHLVLDFFRAGCRCVNCTLVAA